VQGAANTSSSKEANEEGEKKMDAAAEPRLGCRLGLRNSTRVERGAHGWCCGHPQAYGAGGKSQFLVGVLHHPKIHTSPRPRLMTGRFMVCHPTASSQCCQLHVSLIGFEFGDFMLGIDIIGHGTAVLSLCAAVLTARERRRCCHRRSVRGRLDL
jgi:hypothetical protein